MATVALTGVQASVYAGAFFVIHPYAAVTYTVGAPWVAVVPFGGGTVTVT
jgi:hypothetical protein